MARTGDGRAQAGRPGSSICNTQPQARNSHRECQRHRRTGVPNFGGAALLLPKKFCVCPKNSVFSRIILHCSNKPKTPNKVEPRFTYTSVYVCFGSRTAICRKCSFGLRTLLLEFRTVALGNPARGYESSTGARIFQLQLRINIRDRFIKNNMLIAYKKGTSFYVKLGVGNAQ